MKTSIAPLVCALFALAVVTTAWASESPARPVDGRIVFANRMVQAINQRDMQALNALINRDALSDRMASKVTDDLRKHAELKQQAAKGLDTMLKNFMDALTRMNAKARFMRLARRESDIRVLLRADMQGGGFDYLEYIVTADGAGNYRAIDWYALTGGQLVSDSFGAVFRLMVDPDPGFLKQLMGVQSIDPGVLESIRQLGVLQRQGKFAEALASSEKWPPAIRDSKVMRKVRLQLATAANDTAAYQRIVAALDAPTLDDPGDAVMLIDYYFRKQQYPQALRAIGVVERWSGKDGMTQLMSANANCTNKDYANCIASAQEAIRVEPEMEDPYWVLAQAYASSNDYASTAAALRTLTQKFQYKFTAASLAKDPIYAGFLKSPEGRALVK
jgi:tetratricopeptide (TPR) repeat protein